MTSVLTLVGLATLFAGGVVEGSLRYANVVRFRYVVSFLMVPGLYAVCGKLLKRCRNSIALVFSPGRRDSRKDVLGFESSGTYKYIGLHSGTCAYVLNPFFEAWLNIQNSKTGNDSAMFRDKPNMGTKCTIGLTHCTAKKRSPNVCVCELWYIVAAIPFELAAIAVLVLMAVKGDIAGFVINITNMIVYFMINFVVTRDVSRVSRPQPAKNVKEGDIMITDKYNNKLWIVKGNEPDIQSAAQKEVEIERGCNEYIETFVYILGTLISVATILVVPIMNKQSQIYIVIQFGLGLIVSIIFSSKDGERMLKNIFDEYYEVNVELKVFTNRATAVAAGVMYAKANTDQIHSEILPVTPEFTIYRKVISDISRWNDKLEILKNDITKKELGIGRNDSDILEIAKRMVDAVPVAEEIVGAPAYNNLHIWPGRLLIDITEAFVEVYCK